LLLFVVVVTFVIIMVALVVQFVVNDGFFKGWLLFGELLVLLLLIGEEYHGADVTVCRFRAEDDTDAVVASVSTTTASDVVVVVAVASLDFAVLVVVDVVNDSFDDSVIEYIVDCTHSRSLSLSLYWHVDQAMYTVENLAGVGFVVSVRVCTRAHTHARLYYPFCPNLPRSVFIGVWV
jgi:hypothetical protein